jgi:PAS domain S-box-containing protein
VLLVLVAMLPAFGVSGYTAYEQQRRATANARDDALRLARLAAANQERLIEGARLILGALAHLPVVLEGDARACSALFEGFRRGSPQFTNFSAVRLNGDVFCSGVPLDRPVNVADRTYHRTALRTRQFAVGEYAVGRASGRASLFLAYPAIDAAGEVRALVTAGLDLGWLNRLAAEVPLPPRSTISIIDGTGTILARHPDPEQWVGKSGASLPAFGSVRAASGEGIVEGMGVDGVPRVFGFVSLRVGGDAGRVFAVVGLPSDVIRTEALRALWRNLALLGLITALTLALAWVGTEVAVLRQGRRLLGATRRLAAGDLAARAGPPYQAGEVGELARAFDGMAAALEARTDERERILEELRESEARFRATFESANVGKSLTRPTGEITVNRAFCDLLGYAPEELRDKTWQELTPAEDIGAIQETLSPLLGGARDAARFEKRDVHKNGSHVWADVSVVIQRDRTGTPLHFITTIVDITDRKRAEAERRVSAELFSKAFRPPA